MIHPHSHTFTHIHVSVSGHTLFGRGAIAESREHLLAEDLRTKKFAMIGMFLDQKLVVESTMCRVCPFDSAAQFLSTNSHEGANKSSTVFEILSR